MSEISYDIIRKSVRDNYAKISVSGGCCSSIATQSCCTPAADLKKVSGMLGYSAEQIENVPDNANLGLGCGNPQAIAALRKGETVLDLGSGAGFDAFLAAKAVGPSGHVIGVDMTPEMLDQARRNKAAGGYGNVEFRLGEIENLPVADHTVDVILSNCVINLSPEKDRVFRESFRVLKSGGRLAISDVVTTAELPEEIRSDMNLLSGCIAGADSASNLEKILKDAGFTGIRIQPKDESREFIKEWAPGRNAEEYIVSATIEAVKP
jgi:arsenite methyltransferase